VTYTNLPFTDWLRQRRRALDMTQAELARRVGCSAVLVAKLESGERRPSKQIAALLAEQLQVPPAERDSFVQFARGLAPDPQPPEAAAAEPGPPLPPPPPSPAPVRHTLPVPAIRLVGRQAELARVEALLGGEARLVTITGPGGVGKTRLAIEAARRLAPQGARFVSLAPLESPELLAPTLAAAVGVGLPPAGDPAEPLAAALRGRDTLLVLDNLDQLLSDDTTGGNAAVNLLAELLRRTPDLRILATSRERLSLSDEWVVDLAGLDGPGEAAGGASAELFVEAARRLRAGYAPSPEERAAIDGIGRAVGGLPLAIELAAAWVGTLNPAEIAAELARSTDILASQARDLPPRHRSMRAAFDHSWAMLRDEERAALARLSLFRDGFSREAAAYVARADLPLLAALLQKSLLRRAADGRYDLHPLVRRFSRERLAERGEADETIRRYVDYYLALAAQGHEEMGGQGQRSWVELLASEHDNLRGALDLACRHGLGERGARLGVALLRFWRLRGHYREGLSWAERLLKLHGAPQSVRAQLLEGASTFAGALDGWPQAMAMAEQALALRRADPTTDPGSLACTLLALGEAEHDMLEFERARGHFDEAVALLTGLDDPPALAAARKSLANVLYDLGDAAASRRLHSENLAGNLARGDLNAAAIDRTNLGLIAALTGDYAAAAPALADALSSFVELGNRTGQAFCLSGIAAAAGATGRPSDGARLLGAADALRAATQAPISPANRPHFARLEALARAGMSPPAFEAARNAARAEPPELGVALAIALARDLL